MKHIRPKASKRDKAGVGRGASKLGRKSKEKENRITTKRRI